METPESVNTLVNNHVNNAQTEEYFGKTPNTSRKGPRPTYSQCRQNKERSYQLLQWPPDAVPTEKLQLRDTRRVPKKTSSLPQLGEPSPLTSRHQSLPHAMFRMRGGGHAPAVDGWAVCDSPRELARRTVSSSLSSATRDDATKNFKRSRREIAGPGTTRIRLAYLRVEEVPTSWGARSRTRQAVWTYHAAHLSWETWTCSYLCSIWTSTKMLIGHWVFEWMNGQNARTVSECWMFTIITTAHCKCRRYRSVYI
jgi:hypothetical protein